MNGNRIDLTQICQRYKARIIRVVPLEDYYLVETNRGPKDLREWPRVDVMRWSFHWREQMARLGLRNVERFIRTRDAKPYVVVGKKGYTLTDHLRTFDPYVPTSEHAHYCGQMVARMHQAQAEHQFPIAVDLMKREQNHVVSETKRARELYKEFSVRHAFPSEQNKWVKSQFRPLLERMERSADMLSQIQISDDILAVSHRHLGPENWGLVNEKLYLRGFYRPNLSVQHRDTAEFLRQMYVEQEDFNRVDAFLAGYEETKPISYQEYALLLAFMAFPLDVWKGMEEYILSPLFDEEAQSKLQQSMKQQQKVDHLLQHIALRAESRGRIYE